MTGKAPANSAAREAIFAAGLWRLLLASLLALCSSGCLYGRIVYFNTPDLTAPEDFANRKVRASSHPQPLPRSVRAASFQLSSSERERYGSFEQLLEAEETRAFLVLKDDVLVYERYFGEVGADTELPGFSMSKTYAALLVARAIEDGLLGSLDDKLVSYIPELAQKPGYASITLEQLLRMISGIDFDEESVEGAKLYYTTHLRDLMYGYDVVQKPGQHYTYGSVNIQLLWDVLQRRLGRRTVSQYFAQALWEPLGATRAASWSLDSEESGIEKFFGGFNATARDHARIGLLFLHRGALFDRQIVAASFVDHSLRPDPIAGLVKTSDGQVRRGKYQWFLTQNGRGYFAKGYHGQYVFVVPDRQTVFVRFGEGYGDVAWTSLFLRLADQLGSGVTSAR